uniref:Fructose-1,6-bisphosphatase, cytosolic n=1 Tax=Alexandrium catenella TaxID=2925 RepID=A0A7S1PXM1_ALECA
MGLGRSRPQEELTAEVEKLRQDAAKAAEEHASLKRKLEKLTKDEADGAPPTDRKPTEFDPYLFPINSSMSAARAQRMTITEYIVKHTENDQELAMLMNSIQHACKVVAYEIGRAGPADLYGLAGVENATGDDVKKLDLIADDIWVECLSRSGVCALLVSEEQEECIIIEDENKRGPFCCAFDPLDGSSNIDCNVSVGSIFSVYRRLSPHSEKATPADILRPGTDIVVSGYCMYGAATELVITFGKGVQRFALDPAFGEFLYVSDMVMDPTGGKKIFSCNEGNSLHWDAPIATYVEECKDNGYAARYVGSMVSDVHRTLLYGGIFIYPADKKSTKGKLRVLYEGFPMAMITEQAKGVSSTGLFKGKLGRILEVKPEHIHDRCPIIMGCARDVNKILSGYEKEQQEKAA